MIIDSTFKDIKSRTSVNNADVIVSNSTRLLDTWHIKTKNGAVSSVISKAENGLRVEAYYPALGYLYVRQIISGIQKYEGKKFKLKIDMSRDSWQPLNYDIYITNRYSSDDENRVTLVDTESKALTRGNNTIEVEFEVPKEKNRVIDNINGLSIAFRLIGNAQNTACTIKSIALQEVVQAQQPSNSSDNLCSKLRALVAEMCGSVT